MQEGRKEVKVKIKHWINGVKRGYKPSLNQMKRKRRNWREECSRKEEMSNNYGN